ncbi:MAG TPA: sigma-70 family RNA polymerase sigma factor [Myxococcaceae bacterium]|nr:sigma-70 family RNA polymerase sigma factor [Myxococcaceae bacterium]
MVSRLLAGDEALFAALVDRWQPGLLRLARAITGNAASAEDVVQETWVSMLRSLLTFAGRSSLRTWVHGICAHLALARIRQDSRSPVPSGPAVDPSHFDEQGAWREPPLRWTEETPEAVAARHEVIECIERTVEMLPVRQRVVITLRDVQGFSSDEACEILGVSEVHQRVLLHRARSQVRTECERLYREAA